MGVRRKAREFAVQTIYAQEVSESPWEEVVNDFIKERELTGFLKDFYYELCKTFFINKEEIDRIIKKHLKNWDFDRLALVEKAVLRLALTEMFFFDDIPPSVSIDEAIEIVKKYSLDKSAGFVNGLLDAIKLEEKVK